jgi:hypothetical protein
MGYFLFTLLGLPFVEKLPYNVGDTRKCNIFKTYLMVLALTPSSHTLLACTKKLLKWFRPKWSWTNKCQFIILVVLLFYNIVSYSILPIRNFSPWSLPCKTNVNDEMLNAKNRGLGSHNEELGYSCSTEIMTSCNHYKNIIKTLFFSHMLCT